MIQNLEKLVKSLVSNETEDEWYEFKSNLNDKDDIGEYISALSNVAAYRKLPYAYIIWGVHDKTHELIGTQFNYKSEVNGEALSHYLARKLEPSVNFEFDELNIDDKRIVVLSIPSSKAVPTEYNNVRYFRIGSSKVKLSKYHEKEIRLFEILNNKEKTLINVESESQDLSFNQLFLKFEEKKVYLDRESFEENLRLLTSEKKYNKLAEMLSDNFGPSVRFAAFNGKDKTAPMYAVKELGMTSLVVTMDTIFNQLELINVPQADERNRGISRVDTPLFDINSAREAAINSILHNQWLIAPPMFTMFSDRLEITSFGGLPAGQTIDKFFIGKSVPTNEALANIFAMLSVSEKTGKGVPLIVKKYGRSAFEIDENTIVVTIPFNRINIMSDSDVSDKNSTATESLKNNRVALTKNQNDIINQIVDNPYITIEELMNNLSLSDSGVRRNIKKLKDSGYIKRNGSSKIGYWEILK